LAILDFCLEQNRGRFPCDSRMMIERIIGPLTAIGPAGRVPSFVSFGASHLSSRPSGFYEDSSVSTSRCAVGGRFFRTRESGTVSAIPVAFRAARRKLRFASGKGKARPNYALTRRSRDDDRK